MRFNSLTLVALFLLNCFTLEVEAKPAISNLPNKASLEKLYYKHFNQFSKRFCTHGEDQKFEKIFQEFKGRGDYVPTTDSDLIDKVAIRKNIPFFKEKLRWINENLARLKNYKNFNDARILSDKVRAGLHQLLEYKKDYFFATNSAQKELAKSNSRKEFVAFKKLYSEFLESIFFLKTFHFPVDFYELRRMYDAGTETKFTRTQLRLFRKIVEDGAQNPDHKKSDRFVRTALSAVYLSLMSHHTIISEDLRFDIDTTLKSVNKIIAQGVSYQTARLQEWKERTEDEITFYKKLLSYSTKQQKRFLSRKKTGEEKLKRYVKRKQEAVYNYWSKRPEYLRAIYALETILMNEVGDVDDTGLERRDVAQVVINRWHKHWYGYLGQKDFLFDVKSNPKTRKRLAKFRWLNVLFKTGEFSFTYYFIHSNNHIFCPDMSPHGKKLRQENVKIAIDSLKGDRTNFKAERYFSRASMVGRVDMTNIWSNFIPYPERAGEKILNDQQIRKKYEKGEFEYFYYFKDPWGRFFKVVEIDDTPYAVSFNGKEFYTYRNRHYFKYFIPSN